MSDTNREEPTLLEAFERTGEWWLPEDHRDRVAGTASFDPNDGIRLQTIGAFKRSWRGTGSEKPFRPPLVLGFSGPTNTPVTLHKTTRVGDVRASLGRPDSSTLHAVCMIVGHHFHSEETVTFVSARARFTSFEEWAGHHPFDSAAPDEARYAPLESVTAEVGTLGARLAIGSESSRGGDGVRTLRLDHRVFVDVEPEERRPLKWYRNVLSSLQDLFTLLVGRPVYPRSMQAQVNTGASARSDVFFGQGLRLPRGQGPVPAEGLVRPSDVLVPLPLIRAWWPQMLENWFRKAGAARARLRAVLGRHVQPQDISRLPVPEPRSGARNLPPQDEPKRPLPPGEGIPGGALPGGGLLPSTLVTRSAQGQAEDHAPVRERVVAQEEAKGTRKDDPGHGHRRRRSRLRRTGGGHPQLPDPLHRGA